MQEEIKCEQRNYGERRAATLLLKRILQKDQCLYEFICALRHDDIDQSDLADMLDPNHFYDKGIHVNPCIFLWTIFVPIIY